MRRFFVLSSTLVLVLGCGKDDNSKDKRECHVEAINLSSCQRSTLAGVQPTGVWNVNVELSDGSGSAGAFKLSGAGGTGAKVLGLAVTDQQISQDTVYLASDVMDTYDRTLRFAFAACEADGAGKMTGVFRRCVDGSMDLQGTFEAMRVGRNGEETEASGVELVGEAALTAGAARAVAVAGGYAYLAAGTEGLLVYDVSNPAQPTRVATAKPSDDAYNDLLVRGSTLYVASQKVGVVVFDVTDPKAPARVRSVPDTSVALATTSLAIDGNTLYAASSSPNGEVLIFDLTTVTQPKLIDRYYVDGALPANGELPMDVAVLNNRLYVSNWTFGLSVSDATNPADPKLLGRFAGSTSRTATVGVINGRTYAFDAGEDWGAHVSVLDVGNAASVLQVGGFSIRPQVSIATATLSGTKLYVAYYQDGLRVLDVSNPSMPRQVGYYNSWREADTGRGLSFFEGLSNITVPGDGYIYATETSRGLMIFRETN
ncbi:hypothetical protein LZ198_01770 [Myxococcus sp. K15C18031901]|uniref:LVIVD repeat-containing protein n=1 Tax=Myxococcus dinghuensis TaxID=2906761 RepID=UPI0020A7147D|nr:hypothetical protein [Myxococcus dinghuensis]MCP3097598.1 hypothetical protein [Myxococcus dinghuensis]